MPCCNCGKAYFSWQKESFTSFAAYKASVQRARYGFMEKTADLRKESDTYTSNTLIAVAKQADDQEFTLVFN